MKKCFHCKRKGFQAERFFGIPKLEGKCLCLECALSIYMVIKAYVETGKASTGKL